MKASDNFKIDSQWWSKGKPTLMKSTGLGAAMKKFEDARLKLADITKAGKYTAAFDGANPFNAARAMLDNEIKAAIAKATTTAGKTFKDVATVLAKSPPILAATKNTINSMEKDFLKNYQANHFGPKMNQVQGVLNKMEEEKTDSETTFKEVERFSKKIEDELANSKSKDAKVVLQAVEADLAKIKERCDVLAKKLSEAETAMKLASKIFAETTNVMSFDDRDTFKEFADKSIMLKNAVFDVASRTKMLQAGATTAVKDFKSGSASGKKPADEKQLKRLIALKTAMVQNQDVVRKIENNFSNTVLMPQKMIDAIKKAPNRAAIEMPKGVSIPVDRWVANAETWVTDSTSSQAQAQKIYDQSKATKESILKQIDDAVQKDTKGDLEIKAIESNLGGIKTYVDNVGKYVSIFTQKLKLLKSEWEKKQ